MKLIDTWVVYDLCVSEIIEVFSDKDEATKLYDIKIEEYYIKNRKSCNFFKKMSDEQYDEHFKTHISSIGINVITLEEAIDNIKERLTDKFESIIYPNYN